MIIYGSSISPFVRKTLAFAAEKGVAVEVRAVNPRAPSAEFSACSPFRKMPALSDGDYSLSDSTAIITYIEAAHPQPNLIPLEPKARGRTIWFEEFADTILHAAGGRVVFNRVVAPMLGMPADLAAADAGEREDLPPMFDYLESVIPASGFLVEDRLTLADIAVCSSIASVGHANCHIDPARWPKTAAYAAAILARPSFAALIAQEKATLAAGR